MRLVCLASALIIAFFIVTGCNDNKQQPFKEWWAAERYQDFVPPDAQIVAEGTGPLKFSPTTNGTLYLVDLDDMRQVKQAMVPHVIAVGGPLPGPEITFDPNTASFTREGKKPVKLTEKITVGHRYQLRWAPEKLQ